MDAFFLILALDFDRAVLPFRASGITMAPMVSISLKLPDELARRLEAEARIRRMSKSAFVRECLEERLKKNKKRTGRLSFYDLGKDLCGSVTGCPSDIATHPKYLEDFGE